MIAVISMILGLLAPLVAAAWAGEVETAIKVGSPDGTRLAYVTRDERNNCFLRVAAKARLSSSTRAPVSCAMSQLVWSPGGDKLAFEAIAADNFTPTIFLYDTSGNRVQDLIPQTSPFFVFHHGVAISEWLDDNRLAFEQQCGTDCVSLSVINLKDHSDWYFCQGNDTFHWSPDKQLAVVTVDAPFRQGGVHLLRVQDARPLVGHPDTWPGPDCCPTIEGCVFRQPENTPTGEYVTFESWAADSKSFIYGARDCSHGLPGERTPPNLYKFTVDTLQVERVPKSKGPDKQGPGRQPN